MKNRAFAGLIFIIVCISGPIFAQQDSISPGVIKVRRAPVPSVYYAQVSYTYFSPKKKLLKRILHGIDSGFGGAMIDGYFFPPQPVSIPENPNDSSQLRQDSTFLMQFYEKNDRPAEDYAWVNWLDQSEHYFAWSDTAGVDSCLFFYEVRTSGRVNVYRGAPYSNDTSAATLQNELWPIMRKLWLWYPAVQLVGESKKQKKVNCLVTVKVYAVRDDQRMKLPLKIVD